jgi:rhomboid family GlyGly-CTERM serine protease
MDSGNIASFAAVRGPIPRAARGNRHVELLAFAALIALLNLPLLRGGSTQALAFHSGAIVAGEWWRVLTHPFAHVSWYHLLLDGAAFLILYDGLLLEKRWHRLASVALAAAGSLLLAWWLAPSLVAAHGLCGLSGVAHGLMAFSALEWLALSGAQRITRRIALVSFLAVSAKAALEAVTGNALFASFHLGLLGTPIVVCHAGGVLGGATAALMFSRRIISPVRSFPKSE